MDFYTTCRSLRDGYKKDPNKEIELQILSKLYSEYFLNNEQMPSRVIIDLDVKSILKNLRLCNDYKFCYGYKIRRRCLNLCPITVSAAEWHSATRVTSWRAAATKAVPSATSCTRGRKSPCTPANTAGGSSAPSVT